MSQHGRGSGPHDDDPDGDETDKEQPSSRSSLPPAPAPPIAPYDPYRPMTGDRPRSPTRNVAADSLEASPRSSRAASDDPFLPADDPLSSEAWQLELDDAPLGGDDEATPTDFDFDTALPPRRTRRQPSSVRTVREPAPSARRAPRRSRSSTASARGRGARPAVTIGVPRVVAGSSLVADQPALALIGINTVRVLVMALLLAMRMGSIPSPAVIRLDAAGNPDLWGLPSVLWRLPMMSLFITIMFVVVAWFLHPVDRFAARFALAAAFVAQLVAWAAVIQHMAGT
jgi:hypothetical protein